jgi:hypothetical protein
VPFSEFLDNQACRAKITPLTEIERQQLAAKNAEKRLELLKDGCKKAGHNRDLLREALNTCVKNNIPLPEWLVNEVYYLLNEPSLNRNLSILEKAYQSGNYGALKDAVYWCRYHNHSLPEWANLALFDSLSALTIDNKETLKKWRVWGKQYRQDIADYEVYDSVKEARERGAEWKDVYDIAGSIISNKMEEDGGAKSNTIEATYKKVVKRLKERPLRYYQLRTYMKGKVNCEYNFDLRAWIEKTIKAGKPKGIKKTID